MEPSYDASDCTFLEKNVMIAHTSPPACFVHEAATEGSRDMSEQSSLSHLHTPEKPKHCKRSLAETCKNLGYERRDNHEITHCNEGSLLLDISCQAGAENNKLFKKGDLHSSGSELGDIVIDVKVAGSLSTGNEVTECSSKSAIIETIPPLLPDLETGDGEKIDEVRHDLNQSLCDAHDEDDSANLPHKSSVPRFVYGICNTSSYKSRKKEMAKSPMGRKSATLSTAFKQKELKDKQTGSLSMFCNVNGHDSDSGSHREMSGHPSDRTQEHADPAVPFQTSNSNYENDALHTGSTIVPSELTLQQNALDLTFVEGEKSAPVSSSEQDEDISYVAEFGEEQESCHAEVEEQSPGRSSKKGFLSITGLIQKRRTPMMKRYRMKDSGPRVGDDERNLSLESGHQKSMASHPMIEYYEKLQRDSQSVRPSEENVSMRGSSSEREDSDLDAGHLTESSTEKPVEGVSNHESMAHQSMVKYYKLVQGLSKTAEEHEQLPQDGGETNSATQEKEKVPSNQPAEVVMEDDPNKRFKCKVCGRSFRHSQGLTAHKKIHSEERRFECPHCDLKFRVKQNMITHIRTHTGEKPHSCEVCGRGFRQQSTLVRHLRSHTGEKPYKCEYCQRTFTQRHVMMNHVKIHTGEKPYTCELCGKDFKEQHNLYPNKKMDVLEVRVEEHHHDREKEVEYWKKVMVCRNIMPSILKNIPVFNKDAILLEEECWYHHREEMMKIKSRNITWHEYAQAWEESELQKSKDSHQWTMMSQRGGMDVKVFGALGRIAELFCQGAAKRNGMRAIKHMEDLMVERRRGAKDFQT